VIYSVWRPHLRAYDYYEATPGPEDVEVPSPGHLGAAASQIGATPEEASWRLPGGARKVGQGAVPRGMIAREGGFPALSGLPTSGLGLVGLGVGAYLLWQMFRTYQVTYRGRNGERRTLEV